MLWFEGQVLKSKSSKQGSGGDTSMDHWPQRVQIREVSLRDGLQSLSQIVPTANKLLWLDAAYEAGLRELEVGSFVPAKLMPQLADTQALVSHALRYGDAEITVLVPNLKGAERAIDSGAHWMLLPLSASRAHSLANLRKPREQVVEEIAQIVALRAARGSSIQIEVGISTAFGCTLQGAVPLDDLVRLVREVAALGVHRIGLADTVGYADPRQVGEAFHACAAVSRGLLDKAHFHDTRGLGAANVMAALQAGQTRFDACVGGIGGCPHAPGASGNVSTEDLAYLFASMGIATGLDLPRLFALRTKIAAWLEGAPLFGSIAQAGLPKTFSQAAAA
jgi:hydroxymethylglutaryl-CoA lyase